MPALLIVALIVVPIAELYVLISVGHAIGVLPTIALLLLDSVVGASLLRREGRRTWQAFRLALAERRVPAREVADGALVLFGGALLITPGFISDVVGLLCLLPPGRRVLRRLLVGSMARRLGPVGLAAGLAARRRTGSVVRGAGVARGAVVDRSVVDGSVVEPPQTS